MKTCLNCFRAMENIDTGHCMDCPCCSVCVDHALAGCPLCNADDADGPGSNPGVTKPPLGRWEPEKWNQMRGYDDDDA